MFVIASASKAASVVAPVAVKETLTSVSSLWIRQCCAKQHYRTRKRLGGVFKTMETYSNHQSYQPASKMQVERLAIREDVLFQCCWVQE